MAGGLGGLPVLCAFPPGGHGPSSLPSGPLIRSTPASFALLSASLLHVLFSLHTQKATITPATNATSSTQLLLPHPHPTLHSVLAHCFAVATPSVAFALVPPSPPRRRHDESRVVRCPPPVYRPLAAGCPSPFLLPPSPLLTCCHLEYRPLPLVLLCPTPLAGCPPSALPCPVVHQTARASSRHRFVAPVALSLPSRQHPLSSSLRPLLDGLLSGRLASARPC